MTSDEPSLRDSGDPAFDDRADRRPAPGDPPSFERNSDTDGELERALAAFYA